MYSLNLGRYLLVYGLLNVISLVAYADNNVIVFKSNSNYHYRIPAIVANTESTPARLYAFSEKRHIGSNSRCKDSGEIDIVMKVSDDKGKTWSSEAVIVGANPVSDSINQFQAYTNPTAVITLNKIHLLFNSHYKDQCATTKKSSETQKIKTGDRTFWYKYGNISTNSWSKAKQIKVPQYLRKRIDMVGPGNGIYTDDKTLIFPASGKNIISNNDGQSWTVKKMRHGGSESAIVELCNGLLMRNDRPGFKNTKFLNANKANNHVYSIGNADLNKWSRWRSMNDVTMPKDPWVQASLIRLRCTKDNETVLAFSTPNHPKFRQDMSIFISEDSGNTWQKKFQITQGKSDYSSLVKLSDTTIGILYEAGFGAKTIRYSSVEY